MPPKKSSVAPIVLEETLDALKLAYILENLETFPLREETLDDHEKWSPTVVMTEALRMMKGGVLEVKYKQSKNEIGRYYAFKGRSLQGMPREIRHTVARDFYVDIDIVNCHPTLLLQYCKKNDIPCIALEDYVLHRDDRMNELLTATGLSKDDAKRGVLALTNGGAGCFRGDVLRECPRWVFLYKENMSEIHETIFKGETEFSKLGEKNAKEKKKAGGFYNPKGSTMNLLLCDLENRVLMTMLEYGRRVGAIKKNAVLVFDGLMLHKPTLASCGKEVPTLLREMEDYVKATTGYGVQLVEKPMDDFLTLPNELVLRDAETVIRDDENEASMIFYDRIKNDIRRCCGMYFVRKHGVWVCDKDEVEKILLDRCMRVNFVRVNDDGVTENYSAKLSGARSIVQATMCRIPDEPMFIDNLWWSNKGKLVFKDGYYDFEKATFVAGFAGCDSMVQVERRFPVRNDALIEEVYRRVVDPILGDLRVPFLQFLARAMAGHCEDKNWAVLMGQRDCGKGVLATLAQTAFGAYVSTISPESLLCQRLSLGGDEAKKLSWSFAMEHTRLAITNEIRLQENDKLKLDGNMIKKVASGGDVMMARQNYKDERQFRIQASLLLNCNDLPDIDPTDACEKLLPYSCPNKFTNDPRLLEEFPDFMKLADDRIKEFCRRPEVGDAFFWIVADHYRAQRPTITDEMRRFKSNFHQEDEQDKVWQHFVVTRNTEDFVSKQQVKSFLQEKKINMTTKKFYLLVVQRGATDVVKQINGKNTRGYRGVKWMDMVDPLDD